MTAQQLREVLEDYGDDVEVLVKVNHDEIEQRYFVDTVDSFYGHHAVVFVEIATGVRFDQ